MQGKAPQIILLSLSDSSFMKIKVFVVFHNGNRGQKNQRNVYWKEHHFIQMSFFFFQMGNLKSRCDLANLS